VEGKLNRYADYVKESTGSRNWQAVRKMIVAAEEQGLWPPKSDAALLKQADRPMAISEAVSQFLSHIANENGRNLAPPTASKYRTVLIRLQRYCDDTGLIALAEVTLGDIQRFKATWPTGALATKNNIQRLRSFFRHCKDQGWIGENAAQRLEMPRNIKATQKLPFTEFEMSRILSTAQTMELNRQQAVDNSDLYAFIIAMRYTGLRISDVGLLTSDRFHGNALFLYAKKNGAHVYCPLLPWVAAVLKAVPLKQGKYLFCTGSNRLQTVVELWRKRLRRVFDVAGIAGASSHRFRHTFAVDLLSSGADIKNVSVLLGHESVLTTEEHYSAWVQSRQDNLNADVLRAYANRKPEAIPA